MRIVGSVWEGEPGSSHRMSTKVSPFGDSVPWRVKINFYQTTGLLNLAYGLRRSSPLCVPLCLSRNLTEGGAPCVSKLQYFPDPYPRITPTTLPHSTQAQPHCLPSPESPPHTPKKGTVSDLFASTQCP